MPTQAIPADVRHLIRQHLPSMSHVDVLVALARAQGPLTLEEVAQRCSMNDALALSSILDLIGASIATAAGEEAERRYSMRVDSTPQMRAIHLLAEIASARPVSLVRFVYERPPESDRLHG